MISSRIQILEERVYVLGQDIFNLFRVDDLFVPLSPASG